MYQSARHYNAFFNFLSSLYIRLSKGQSYSAAKGILFPKITLEVTKK